MSEAFAIWPDHEGRPTAFFSDLEDATEWALAKYGSDRFSIKWQLLETAAPGDEGDGPDNQDQGGNQQLM